MWTGREAIRKKGMISFYLEARINHGEACAVGSGKDIQADQEGMLEMRMRDDGTPTDNDGAISVSITSMP